MMYEWDVQTNVNPDKLKDVLNEFDGAGYDIYSVFQEVYPRSEALRYTIVARLPKFKYPLLDEINE